jgi:hypothetical protein
MVLHQVRETLVRQVIDRGESQVKSLSLNSVDPSSHTPGRKASRTSAS